jgi:hypothetical protein
MPLKLKEGEYYWRKGTTAYATCHLPPFGENKKKPLACKGVLRWYSFRQIPQTILTSSESKKFLLVSVSDR